MIYAAIQRCFEVRLWALFFSIRINYSSLVRILPFFVRNSSRIDIEFIWKIFRTPCVVMHCSFFCFKFEDSYCLVPKDKRRCYSSLGYGMVHSSKSPGIRIQSIKSGTARRKINEVRYILLLKCFFFDKKFVFVWTSHQFDAVTVYLVLFYTIAWRVLDLKQLVQTWKIHSSYHF